MTVRLAVIGSPIAHSLSPAMHRAALGVLGVDAQYDAIDVSPETLASFVGSLRAPPWGGVNVTLPHKTRVLDLLDALDAPAASLGAVNTIVREGGRLVGTNTDAPGLRRALGEAGLDPTAARVVVLGAGGAARASVVALEGASIVVAARREAEAREVAALDPRARACAWSALRTALAHADVLVQATSATLGEGASAFVAALPLDALPPHATVVDLVYRPRTTALLAAASERGLRTIDGTGMLVHQGALALERWLGVKAPVDVMRAALERALG